MAGLGLVFAGELDRQFAGFGAGIAEEHGVGKRVLHEALRQPLLPRNAEQVGGVPKALGLLRHGGDDMRMAVTEAGHGNSAGEIEEFAAVGRVEIRALAPFDGNIPPTVGRHNGWYHDNLLRDFSGGRSAGSQVYRRRRCPTSAAPRPSSHCRFTSPGSPIIALSSLRRGGLRRPIRRAGKRRSMRSAITPVNSRGTTVMTEFTESLPHVAMSRRAGLPQAVTADFGPVERRKSQEPEGGQQRQKSDQEKGHPKILDCQHSRTGDQRQQGGADCDAKASGQLLSGAADAGALAQYRAGHVGVADRVEAEILDAAYAPGQQNEQHDQPSRRVGAQQAAAGSHRRSDTGGAGEQPAEPEEPQKSPRESPHEHRAEARRKRQETGLQRAEAKPDLEQER